MKLFTKIFGALTVFTLVFGLVACGEKSSAPAPIKDAAEAVEETSLDDMMSDAKDVAEDAMDEAEDMIDDAADEIEDMADDASDAIEDAVDDAEDAMNNMMKK